MNEYKGYKLEFLFLRSNLPLGNKRITLEICFFNYCNSTYKGLTGMRITYYKKDFQFLLDFPEQIFLGEKFYMIIHPENYFSTPTYVKIHCNIVSQKFLSINDSSIGSILSLI